MKSFNAAVCSVWPAITHEEVKMNTIRLKKTRWMIASAAFSLMLMAAGAHAGSGSPAPAQTVLDRNERMQTAPASRMDTPAVRSGWNQGSYDAGRLAPKAINRFDADSASQPSVGAGQVDNTCSQPGFNQRNKLLGQTALLC